MTITSELASPTKIAIAPGPPVALRRKRSPGWKLAGTCLIAGILVFNAWWYWRDARPLSDLGAISSWIQQERYAEAETALRESLRRSPHSAEARMMLARALAGRGDLLDCARQLHEVPFWAPEKAEALLREGQSYLQLDRAKDAEKAWLEAIKDEPLHTIKRELFDDACRELLRLYANEDRWEDAYPIIWRAYDRASPVDHPVLLSMRMRAELERVSPKDSLPTLERYVAAAADDWEARRALARALHALGRPTEAASQFQACLASGRDDVRAWRDYLTMLLEEGDLDTFLLWLGKPPKSADGDAETWMFRGIARERAGDWQAAAEHFNKAIELNPMAPKYYYRLATAEERLGLHDQAVAHRKRTKEKNDARAQLSSAFAAYVAAVNANPAQARDLVTACKRLATICETMGWARAAQAWNRLAISP